MESSKSKTTLEISNILPCYKQLEGKTGFKQQITQLIK